MSVKSINVQPMKIRYFKFGIKGVTPLIQHAWSKKGLDEMKLTPQERRKRKKVARKPNDEALGATYYTKDGRYALPGNAFKASLINAAHKDIGLEKTLVRKSIHTHNDERSNNPLNHMVIPFTSYDEPFVREDLVRVGQGSSDLRYRPQFNNWKATIVLKFDADLLTTDDIINLVNRAGFGAGLCEMRPEKGGEFGQFEIDTTLPVEESDEPFEDNVQEAA